jgi:hypothetical protein
LDDFELTQKIKSLLFINNIAREQVLLVTVRYAEEFENEEEEEVSLGCLLGQISY